MIEKHMDIVLHNVQVVLKWCTPRILNTWFLPEGFACLCQPSDMVEEVRLCKYAVKNSILAEICNNLRTLKKLNLENGGMGVNDDGLADITKLDRLER